MVFVVTETTWFDLVKAWFFPTGFIVLFGLLVAAVYCPCLKRVHDPDDEDDDTPSCLHRFCFRIGMRPETRIYHSKRE